MLEKEMLKNEGIVRPKKANTEGCEHYKPKTKSLIGGCPRMKIKSLNNLR